MEVTLSHQTRLAVEGNRSFVSFLAAFCMFCYVYYTQLLPTAVSLALFLFGFVLVCSKWIKTCNEKLLPPATVFAWVLFSLLAILSALLTGRVSIETVVLCLGSLVLYMTSMSVDNFTFFYKTSLVMLIPHAIATIVFFVFPSLYTLFFKPLFMGDIATAMDYQSGLTSHYSYNAMYLVTGLIATFAFLRSSNTRRNRLVRCGFILFLIALLLTTKRAHIGFGILSCIFMYICTSRVSSIRPIVICSFGALLSLVLIVSENNGILQNLFDQLFATRLNSGDLLYDLTTGRTELWSYALEGWLAHPVFGNGWDSFRMVWANGVSVSVGAHNVYLQLLYEVGVIGCAFFVVLQVYAARAAYHALKTAYATEKPESTDIQRDRCIATFACGYQLFFFLYCFTGNPLYDPQMFFVYLLSIASVVALLRGVYGKVNNEYWVADSTK